MRSTKPNRRKFLAALAGSATAGVLIDPSAVFSKGIAEPASCVRDALQSEYLFADGVTYLNTGTLGPCRRETIQASMKAWEELESFPVKFYGKFGAEELAEKTRTIAARFLGCDLSEILITSSTTNGMNALAQGLRLNAGDRILTTDQEHGGGLLCWKYFEKYYGVKLDTVTIPRR